MELDPEYLLAAQTLADLTNVRLPKTYYRYAPVKCWKCRDDYGNLKKILVFDWPRGAPETTEPRPITLVSDKLLGNINTCPHCGEMQGQYRLHHTKSGPFFYVKLSRLNTHESFTEDINTLAAIARSRRLIK